MDRELEIVGTARNGYPIISHECVSRLRNADAKKPDPYNVIVQEGGQERFLLSDADIVIYGGSRGGGKMQPYDAKVCTPFGFRNMGDLKVGSIITDPTTGGMQRVIQIHEHGLQDVWKVTFADGSCCECGAEHLWLVKLTCHISKKRKLNGLGQSGDWRVMTFQQMMEHFDKNKGKSQPSHILIPLTKPVKFTRTLRWDIPKIDPYLLGVILGDGCITDKCLNALDFNITSADEDIIKRIELRTSFTPRYVRQKKDCAAKEYIYNSYPIDSFLYYHGLNGKYSHEKFIPEYCFYDSIENRLELLRGLMDTDGYIDNRGHCQFDSTSKQLSDGVVRLVRSLGGTATLTTGQAGYKKDGEYIKCKDCHSVYIRMKDSSLIFSLGRKSARSKEYNGGCCDINSRMVGYEYIGKKQCRCITVNSPSNLYLTDDFIVTHNSHAILMETLHDITNEKFRALIMRKEKDDLTNLIDKSHEMYRQFGDYNKSKDDMTWNFNRGGALKFGYFADTFSDFKDRWQGKEYPYIAIDEITHMEYNKFKYIITDNRNPNFIRNRVFGTCNPDPSSWLAQFISWWIGDDGFPIPERDGVKRYCFMDGDSPATIIWGDTREEVFEQCKHIIMRYWRDEYSQYGDPKDLFIKSVCFVEGKLADNKQLLRSDPTYLGNLAGQDEAQRSRDLDGNWKYMEMGDELIKLAHMEQFFSNTRQNDDQLAYASCDVALTGGDNLVMCKWVGNRTHLDDIFVCRMDSKRTVETVQGKLDEWGVPQERFTYDLNGLGQLFQGFFPNAIPFNNEGAVDEKLKYVYYRLKSQAAYMFAQQIIGGQMSINPSLLDRRFDGNGYDKKPLRLILLDERRVIRQDEQNTRNGFALPKKSAMKRLIGHSPDFIEAMFMIEIFSIKGRKKVRRGLSYL